MKFNDILISLLKELEKKTTTSVDEIIKMKASELGISETEIAEIEQANNYIDQFDQVFNEMTEARKDGISRAEFVQEKIQKALENVSSEKCDLFLQALDQPKDEQIEKLANELDNEF